MKKLVIIGAGGMGREAAFLVERINAVKNTWELQGFLDENAGDKKKKVNGYKVYQGLEDLETVEDLYFICSIGSSETRKRVVERLKLQFPQIKFATLIDPSILISPLVTIGEGSILAGGSIFTVNIEIGCHNLINMACTIGHDCIFEDFVTLHPGVNVSGNCTLKEGAEMGCGSKIIQGLTVGKETILGAGAVVVREIPPYSTAVGCPAKVIKNKTDKM